MSNTSIKSVYLAQAVDLRDARAIEITSKVKSSLLSLKVVTFDPSEAFQLASVVLDTPKETDQGEFIFGVNLFAFINADMRVFVYTGSASWGMPIELYMAVKKGLPFVFLDFSVSARTPVYLREMFNLAGATNELYGPLHEFTDALVREMPFETMEHLRIWTTPYEEDDDESQD